MFFSFMFIGWVWEVLYTFLLHGELVNRGTLHGPWLPIYGVGGVMIIVLLRRFGEHPLLLFTVSFVSCGIMEYAAGWYIYTFKGLKYWDYTYYFLNLNGYICLEGVFMFAVLSCAGFYFIAPRMDALFSHIPVQVKRCILIALIPAFCADLVYSHFIPNVGEGIGGTDYEQ